MYILNLTYQLFFLLELAKCVVSLNSPKLSNKSEVSSKTLSSSFIMKALAGQCEMLTAGKNEGIIF